MVSYFDPFRAQSDKNNIKIFIVKLILLIL